MWDILFKRKVEDLLHVPNIRKALPITKLKEYFINFLHQTVDEINILLSDIIDESDAVPGVTPPMVIWK